MNILVPKSGQEDCLNEERPGISAVIYLELEVFLNSLLDLSAIRLVRLVFFLPSPSP